MGACVEYMAPLCAMVHVLRSYYSLRESDLSSCHMGARDQTQLATLGGKCLLPTVSPLAIL